MRPEQQKIYYLIADSEHSARHSPYLEVFRARGIEVLLLGERIDEWALSHLREFDGKALCDIARGELDLAELGAGPAAPAAGRRPIPRWTGCANCSATAWPRSAPRPG